MRLAYVAATRARDVLVVPAVGDAPFANGWIRPLNRALYPPVGERQSPQAGAGVPAFSGKDTVLERPDGQMPDASTVRPGAYTLRDARGGEPYTVVWWDPLLLDILADDNRGLRRDDLIAKDARPEDVVADRARYEEWRANKAEVVARGAVPSIDIKTVTEWAKADDSGTAVNASLVTVDHVGGGGARPSGKRFGVLVHALLAAVPLDGDADQIADLAKLHARVLSAPDDERDEAARIVERVLGHRVLAAARRATGACRREAPVSIVLNGTLVDGQVDLAFETS